MKKIILLLMLVCFTGCFIACGKDDVSGTDNKGQDEVSEDNQETMNASDKDTTESQKKENNSDVETDLIGYLYYDHPATHWVKTQGGIDFVMLDGSADESIMIGAFCCPDEANDSIENGVKLANDWDWMDHVSSAGSGGPAFGLGYDIVMTSSETTTIAGVDAIKFIGTAPNRSREEEWNSYVYGYSFIVDNYPYLVIGVVTPQEQEQSMIDEMKQLVDDIAASMRKER